MAGMVDGLGGEEVNQDVNVQTGSIITQGPISGAGNIFGADIVGTTSISGLNVLAQASGIFARINDTDGALFSASVDSGTTGTFGPKIQIGSCVTTSVGFGSCIFNTLFADSRYWWSATASSGGTFLAVNAGSIVPMVSGILGLNPSGITFKGAASTPYSWVAIGL